MRMKIWTLAGLLSLFAFLGTAVAQRDEAEEPTATLNFLVVKDDNGKPVRNAAVIMHPVSTHGKQSRGGLELKTDSEGKTSFEGVPYGTLRVQVLASGFQTFGEDYEIDKAKVDFTIKLKRPQGQYSIYQDHPEEKKDGKTTPPPDPNAKPQ
jgi:Carboxypeptidase regulatory-like domain